MIEIRALRKAYRTRRGLVEAVRGIDLSVKEHDFCVLLGPSGCGKTSTLRCVAGLEEPDAGEIELDGKLVCSPERNVMVPPERRDIGMVFQSYAVWPHMTVGQVVAYPLTDGRIRVPKSDVSPRVRAALEMVQIGTLESRPVIELSGGEQQRVALARALVSEPRVLLMDEPLSNLDARLRDEMRGEIRRLTRRLGLTTLYVTHDQAEALSLADVVCVMSGGEILERGAPEDLYLHPRQRYTASFLGSMNFLPAAVHDQASVESPLGLFTCQLPEGLQPGAEVTLGIRPEHVCLSVAKNGHQAVRGEIVQRSFLGPDVLYELQVNGLPVSAKVPSVSAMHLTEGSIWVGFPPARWQVFAPTNGVEKNP